ncbi:MarR family transcriptional regulator [Microbacteriaceae bacterium VKM Ac-2854]|nr:MarR family transcriptional regulator [Microbacteriaceae bacterium VKM Ac-2854]
MDSIRTPFNTVVRAQIDLWNALERRLRSVPGAVSIGRCDVLEVAGAAESARVQDIAAALRITVGGASRLVDRLEADGLLVREAHPSDRRSSRVVLTEAGRAALAITVPAINAALAELLGPAGSRELRSAAAALARVRLP